MNTTHLATIITDIADDLNSAADELVTFPESAGRVATFLNGAAHRLRTALTETGVNQ